MTEQSSASDAAIVSHESVRARVQGILRAAQAHWTDEALCAASDETTPGMIVATLLRHSATIATAAADGCFDHTEKPDCRIAADEIIASVFPLSSAGSGE